MTFRQPQKQTRIKVISGFRGIILDYRKDLKSRLCGIENFLFTFEI